MVQEIWKPIEPFEHYQISNLGRVIGPKGFLKLTLNNRGYLHFAVTTPEGQLRIRVHIIVCTVFNGPKPFPEAQCLHRDDMKLNNVADNLYWGTQQDNAKDRARNKRMPSGENHWKNRRLIQ